MGWGDGGGRWGVLRKNQYIGTTILRGLPKKEELNSFKRGFGKKEGVMFLSFSMGH